MSRSKYAISTVVIVVIVVIIVAAAGTAAYLAVGLPKATTTSSTTTTTTTTATTTTTTISTAQTTATTTTTTTPTTTTTSSTSSTQPCLNLTGVPSAQNNSSLAFGLKDIFGNFTQISIHEVEVVNQSSSSNVNITYTLAGTPSINGSQYYEVNVTESAVSSQVSGVNSGTVLMLPNGTATRVMLSGTTFTGTFASLEGLLLMLPMFLITSIGSSLLNATLVPSSAYSVVNQSSVTVGLVNLNETVYSFSTQYLNVGSSNCGAVTQNYTKLLLGLGKVGNSNSTITLMVYEAYSERASNYTVDLQITSLTRAT